MRDRLIELVCDKIQDGYCVGYCNHPPCSQCEDLADYLLANGVIVPPYEVGTKVYVITSQTSNGKNLYIFEDIIAAYQINMGYRVMCFDNHLGEPHWNWDKVFLTKEEAEAELRKRSKDNA